MKYIRGDFLDVHSPEQRRYNMQKITDKNTKPEEIVRKYLYSKGIRYRKNDKRFPGSPDIYIPKYNVAVFVNGCFWHVHDCGLFVMPKTNKDFWVKKFNDNVSRDERNIEELTELGIRVIVVWECGLKPLERQDTLDSLYKMIVNE
ncbi:very short patch repair endonuclease [Macrococcus armenti]|uniref:very short patch repair endonuclease n=1 Tax=Macrococcus armenti TaxID=2875764 RepID=UPI001CD7887E|nr:very short patch repair endonuclease [Macrococcus armenti]UBH10279.1 very short patch repair endonuclease [Macrococcus armenti]